MDEQAMPPRASGRPEEFPWETRQQGLLAVHPQIFFRSRAVASRCLANEVWSVCRRILATLGVHSRQHCDKIAFEFLIRSYASGGMQVVRDLDKRIHVNSSTNSKCSSAITLADKEGGSQTLSP